MKIQDIADKIKVVVAITFVCLFPEVAHAACRTAAEVMADLYNGCLICTFVDMVFDAVNNIVTACYNAIKKPSLYLLIIGLGLWILWQFGTYFVNYKYKAPEGFFTEVGKCFFRTTLVAALLAVPTQKAFDLIVSPIVSMATEITLGILSTDLNVQSSDAAIATGLIKNDICQQFKDSDSSQLTYDEQGNVIYGEGETGFALSPQLKSSLGCIIRSMYMEAAKGIALGNSIYCYSMGKVDLWIIKIPDMGMFTIGILVMVVFFLITLSFSFRVIDFVIRISFVLMLLPLLMVAWVFPITRIYTKKAWDFFLHALIALLGIAIAIALVLKIVMESIGRSEELDTMLNNDQVQLLYQHIYTNGIDWLLFIAIAIIALMLVSKTEQIANHFVSIELQLQTTNVGASIGAKMASMAATTIQAAATVATGGVAIAGLAAKGTIGAASGAGKLLSSMASLSTKAGRQAAKASVKKYVKDTGSRIKSMPKNFKDYAVNKARVAGENISLAPQRAINQIRDIPNRVATNVKNIPDNLRSRIVGSSRSRINIRNIGNNLLERWKNYFNNESERNS